MTHTPGPWEKGEYHLAVNVGDKHIAMISHYMCGDPNVDVPLKEAYANRNLVIAAPEMLDALEADELFHDHVGHCDHCDTGDCKVGLELGLKARIARRDAIAKARGRPKKES